MSQDILAEIFERLDQWRCLPSYQLERRVDIFLSIYLHDLIEQAIEKKLMNVIIPEFPLKKEGNNQSTHVDYLMFAADRSSTSLIELKTKVGFLKSRQDPLASALAEKLSKWAKTDAG